LSRALSCAPGSSGAARGAAGPPLHGRSSICSSPSTRFSSARSPMSLDYLMGYTGLVSFGHAAVLRRAPTRAPSSLGARRRLALGVPPFAVWSSASTRWWSLLLHGAPRDLLRLAHLDLPPRSSIRSSATRRVRRLGRDPGGSAPAPGRRLRDRHAAAQLLPRPGPTWDSPTSPVACSSPHTSARCSSRSGERGPRALLATTSSATRWPCA